MAVYMYYLSVFFIHTVMGLKSQDTDAAAPKLSSCEEVTTAIAVNQITLLKMMEGGTYESNAAEKMESRRMEEAAENDARLQEIEKGMANLQAIVENATQEMVKVVASLREEMATKLASLEQELATKVTSLRDAVSPLACPDGWFLHKSSCYLVDDTPRSWEDSLAYCKGHCGDLTKITSAEEQEFIKAHLGVRVGYWIGLNDRASEGNFVWADGSTPTYTRWHEGQPMNASADHDCVYMYRWYDFDWYDYPCSFSSSNGCVCERPVHG